jgi:hypothetical protein
MGQKTNAVLVHGAWADGSSWSKVITILQDKGFNVTAAQLPLTSLDDDIAVTRNLLATHKGPIVLAGHSYGGVVISGRPTAPPTSSPWSTSPLSAWTKARASNLSASKGPPPPAPPRCGPMITAFSGSTATASVKPLRPTSILRKRASWRRRKNR